MPILGAIVGTTGAGKTSFALDLARKLDAEIICMDSRQVFSGFRIGTAQPSQAELCSVPHHLVDFLDPRVSYSAARFADDVKALCKEHPQTSFLLVGGTGMYLKTLVEGLSALPPADVVLREELRIRYQQEGVDALYVEALRLDPGIREKIMPGDFQRLLRVLEVHAQGAGRWSDWLGKREGGLGPLPTLWLDRDREVLYKRINLRVDHMFASGWAEEIEALSRVVPPEAPAWQSLGYREIHAALSAGLPLKPLYEPIRQQTRHYAKRQLTWFRHQAQAARLDADALSPQALLDKALKTLEDAGRA